MSYVIMDVVKGKIIFQCESEGRKKKNDVPGRSESDGRNFLLTHRRVNLNSIGGSIQVFTDWRMPILCGV